MISVPFGGSNPYSNTAADGRLTVARIERQSAKRIRRAPGFPGG